LSVDTRDVSSTGGLKTIVCLPTRTDAEAGAQFDGSLDQGLVFFQPNANQTWLQPPGHVHAMVADTWGEDAMAASFAGAAIPFAAQRSNASGGTLVLRVVNAGPTPTPLNVTFGAGCGGASGAAADVVTLAGVAPDAENTPSAPDAVAPVRAQLPLAPGAATLTVTLPPYSFVVLRVPVSH